jgi:hypothetical protein
MTSAKTDSDHSSPAAPGAIPAARQRITAKAVVHRVATEDQCCDQNDAAIERQPQQRSEPRNHGFGHRGPGGIRRRQQYRHNSSGTGRHGEESGIQPDHCGDAKSPDRLTGQHCSENEGSGPSTAQPAVVEAVRGRIIQSGRSCATESQRIAERRKRSQCCRMDHADN